MSLLFFLFACTDDKPIEPVPCGYTDGPETTAFAGTDVDEVLPEGQATWEFMVYDAFGTETLSLDVTRLGDAHERTYDRCDWLPDLSGREVLAVPVVWELSSESGYLEDGATGPAFSIEFEQGVAQIRAEFDANDVDFPFSYSSRSPTHANLILQPEQPSGYTLVQECFRRDGCRVVYTSTPGGADIPP